MRKLCVSEAAEVLGITKEAIYNRIRRKSLKSIDENGVKFVLLDDEDQNLQPTKQDEKATSKKTAKTKAKKEPKGEKSYGEFVEFLLTQIGELKDQNKNLQDGKEQLFREKEQILTDTKNEIHRIYQEKDEKFRYFLQMLQKPLLARQNGEYIRPIDVEFKENLDIKTSDEEISGDDKKSKKWVSLAEFLKGLNLKEKKQKKLQKLIIKSIGKSKFVKFKDGVIWVKNEKSIKNMAGEL